MMEYDTVDVMHDVVKTENDNMSQRVERPLTEITMTHNPDIQSVSAETKPKSKTRLELLLEEYQQQDPGPDNSSDKPTPVTVVAEKKPPDVRRSKYMLSKMEFRGREKTETVDNMDLVVDMGDIDRLDHGKPWNRLDNWTKKSKLKEFATKRSAETGEPVTDVTDSLLSQYAQGMFKKQSEVVYNVDTNTITSIPNL